MASTSKEQSKKQLRKEGWEERFTIETERSQEYADLYESLGMEVLIYPVDLETSPECDACIKTDPAGYRVIWTRPKN